MRLRRRQFKYKIPPVASIQNVIIENHSLTIMLIKVEEFYKLNNSLMGMPTLCAVFADDDRICFWPTPDKAYSVRIRYFPALKEM